MEGLDLAVPLLLVDADACPVKEEVYKVAFRISAPVKVVANGFFRTPDHPLIERVIVSDAFDAADDYIADAAGPGAVVVTTDILLADRCLRKGALVIAPNGRAFTADMIGAAVAARAILADLRAGAGGKNGEATGGPAPFRKEDRSRFLQALDKAVTQIMRRGD